MTIAQGVDAWPMSGPWTPTQVSDYLSQCRTPIRLACTTGSGYPAIVSMWYYFDGQRLWCATHREAKILQHLQADSRVGFEIASNDMPYHGVRGSAQVQLHQQRGGEMLDHVIDKYLDKSGSALEQWLRSRRADEVAIEVMPQRISSWDYGKRMSGAY